MGLVARQRAMLLGGVAMLAVSVQPALAQDAEIGQVQGLTLLDRLVIGAGVEKVAIDTPQAVTVIDQEQIDAQQASTVGDLFTSVPGVSIYGSDRVFGQSFNIRGIGALEAADESRIVVNVDGAVKFHEQYRTGSFFSDPELYRRVEVLRGPASSTLYGSGALAGVINFTTKDASDFIGPDQIGAFRLKAAYDSNGNGTLGSGVWAHSFNEGFEMLAAGNWRRADNFSFANGDEATGSEFSAISGLIKGTARFGVNDEQVLRLSYQHWQSDAEEQDYSQTGTLDMFGTVDREITDRTFILAYENPFSDNPLLDVKASVSVSDTLIAQNNSSLAAAWGPAFSYLNADYGYTTIQGNIENTATYSAEDFENFFTFGLQTSHQQRKALTPTGGLIAHHPEGIQNRLGLYAQDELIWNDTFTLIGGARVDFNWLTASDLVAGAEPHDSVAFSPKIAAHYRLTDNFAIFGSYAHTERFPTLDEVFSSGVTQGAVRAINPGLEKEVSDNFELGFSVSAYDLFTLGDNFSVKTTGYYNDITNRIESTPAGPFYYDNIGHARIHGVEVEGAYDSEYVFASLAWTVGYGENVVTGAPLASIPAHQLVATVGGRLPEYDLEFGARGTFAADAPSGAGGAPVEGYQSYDVFANWTPQTGAFEGTELRFSVENIFDTDFQSNLSLDPSKGRTFKVSLARQFDY